MLVKMIIF